MTLDKTKAVRTIVESLDALLEKSGFEKVEEREGITSLDECSGETLKEGLGKIYEHKTEDCKIIINFFLDQKRKGLNQEHKDFLFYLHDYIELNLYLNGKIIKPTNDEYRDELHGSFEEPFGFGWGREEDPITLESDLIDLESDLIDRHLSTTIGYRESKTGYDIAFEKLLFHIDEWAPTKIATVINDAQSTLIKIVQGYVDRNKSIKS